jgi:two-component system, cell cycle sensor histidine kinase and response regulator CckA
VILIPFMKEVVKLLNRSLLESINVRFVEPLEGEYVINADPTRLQQVIMNLAVNARDAMPRGGMLEITLDSMGYGKDQPLPLPDMTPGKWIRMAFSDTGAGISADDLPHIFEPFFTTKSVGQGTGLGLAQVHGIVKQHDGAIAVKSRPGKGTTFTIYLPALIETTPTIRETGPLSFPRSNSGGTVLVVDDNPETLEAVREALEILEYEVMSAHTGQEALTIIDVHQDAIDLVLTDLIMPGMSGVDLYRTLQDRYPALKIMIMSGYPRDKAGDELLEAEEVAWLQKPISIQILAQKVRQMFA